MHPCQKIYSLLEKPPVYGEVGGICRITGQKGKGISFDSWVKKTFNDFDCLLPGTIISNEAAFCFDESSEIVMQKTGKEKPQRFRTYSHIIKDGEWFCLTKADKRKIFQLISEEPELVCLTETGQKHVLFKHKTGFWQLDELHVKPDIELFKHLHFNMCELMSYQFSQAEIISGEYFSGRIMKAGIEVWQKHEQEIKQHRGGKMFDFVSFMLYTDEKKEVRPEPPKKSGTKIQQQSLW